MKRPALVVIDMLNDYFERYEAARKDGLVHSINELAAMMRVRGHPVIWVRQEFDPDLHDAFPEMRTRGIRVTIKGTRGCEILSDLNRSASDRVIIKKRYSAFFRTDLDEILESLQPDAMILAGINTHACIRMTAIDAYQRDWRVVLACDCIDSCDREHHEVTLKYLKDKIASILTNREIGAELQS